MGLKFNINPLHKINLASHMTKALPVTSNKVKKLTLTNKKILQALGSRYETDSKITKIEYHSYTPYTTSFNNNDEIRISIQQTDVYPYLYTKALFFWKECFRNLTKLHYLITNDSATASSVDVQLEIEASESVSGVTTYCLLIHDRIVEYVPFTRERRKKSLRRKIHLKILQSTQSGRAEKKKV
ncbi:hypothetical protein AGLY_017099 [Aphis glycines]|uniref:Uncharacterized protein n=1 Tax=Aphis glycines TaxID=307491 RepID=A0A6G0SVV9_APHGL|nr:hypothetical protein AGLY_017099 [Aphis glycines]